MAPNSNTSVVVDCGCTVECLENDRGVEEHDQLRQARLGLMLASVEPGVVVLQAKQSHINDNNDNNNNNNDYGNDNNHAGQETFEAKQESAKNTGTVAADCKK
ncbi:hypothetical protein IF1G_02536 [Cordyceps javanica]|uniref:Uncharacterized protein n=1 Tax=Cordyceps javanica TaxID=43265 RepID=A0A545W6Q5_9HYPO|nr:hypothetical protein IF1G_02536 [Cordyceps javanica]TQW09670.1 hypothetical protein IF2G_02460 [Cordyceps javanica]